jgi:RimJ/RimL family protein N-acetyltransferase
VSVLETARLLLRRLDADDAPFVLRLVNDPAWLEHIGDKGVRTLDDARQYLREGAIAMYERCGFGLYLVALRDGGEPIGICGLVKRDALADVDLGFALLPQFRGKGYALESAAAVMGYARHTLNLGRIVAITGCDNHASRALLARLGFRREGTVRIGNDGETLELHAA